MGERGLGLCRGHHMEGVTEGGKGSLALSVLTVTGELRQTASTKEEKERRGEGKES